MTATGFLSGDGARRTVYQSRKIMFVLFTHKVASGIETSNAELICLVDRGLIDTASVSWTRGTIIAFNADSHVFDPVKRAVLESFVYSWRV